MKARILFSVAAFVAIAALIYGYVQMSKERKAETAADQPIAAAALVQPAVNGESVITLALKTQQLIGLQTATLAAATLPPEIKAYGRVLDSVTLVALENEAVAARAALQASQLEAERLKKLSAQDNASARALETAEAEMKHDQSALATAAAQLVAALGKAVADEPPDFFRALARQENMLVRLDLPAGETPKAAPTGSQLTLPGTKLPVTADFLGRAATTDPQVQGAGFLFLVKRAPAALTPGLAVTGFLQFPGAPLRGVLVPDAAVVRSDERAWIYVQTGNTAFARREISLAQPGTDGWFVTNEVAGGDKVVVVGAQTLLSEEHQTEIKLGD